VTDPREPTGRPLASGAEHIDALRHALDDLDVDRLRSWGAALAAVFDGGGRLLAAGNGGSAAEAQHLTAELVGRLRDDRRPFSAIALHAETSALTAIGNDYGYQESFARQVRAHGRPGDVLILLSTSGRSPNVLRAAEAAREIGLTVWALTGSAPNPLAERCDDVLAVAAESVATTQECHLVAVHLLCAAVDIALGVSAPASLPAAEPANRPAPLVVVGDAVLDRDLVGVVRRLSPEAPVPVVDDVEVRSRPGGAGLAAVLAAAGGRRVVLVTALSGDRAGRELAALLRARGVELVDLGLAGPTPIKSRVRTGDRSLLMLSQAPQRPAAPRRALTEGERAVIRDAAAVLVSDYGRGVCQADSVRSAIEAATPHVPVVWDPHPSGARPTPGVRLVTPNVAEAARFAPAVGGTGLAADIDRARALLDAWSAVGVAVTRGADGAVLLDADGASPLVVPGLRVHGDPCGAGDRFAVSVAVSLAERALLSAAVTRAVRAAGEFVAAGGAGALVGAPPAEPMHGSDPLARVAAVRAAGGVVVATGGCFDLLHTGHITLLEQARRLGDCLVVCLNDDDSVRRRKGAGRPVVSADDRSAVLGSLASVDGVVVFAEDTPHEALRRIRPDVYVKGGDYRVEDVAEAELVASWGGRTVILPYVDGRSTTRMIDKIAGGGSRV
jgi:rfaE bifunctional protein nucleotidyltransferase chain/domain/rfaE bifunctional protein kinase chain/domain